ncbi:GNAT family N-acetyltransferase [Bizionia saleffrena]|uniref:GNAT family N-acetyltransferase n=1 Tax=Bizionia saleffrena TaxID=291189 RepID=A0A8H2QE99_9FLAO|nr:GNAT family N-acetyltransferase [Bizionia saleffrena]TYB71489.1 GNAT family N-acetyltransferase [Bizionia saleffrena]
MTIQNTCSGDIDAIFHLYDEATKYQKQHQNNSWNGFDRAQIEAEIKNERHFVIKEDDTVVCTFLIAFDNPIIWKDANKDPALYLHRIATHPDYRGRGYVTAIVDWSKTLAVKLNKSFIRLDTHAKNDKINAYYSSCGFTNKGISFLDQTPNLPEHYKAGEFTLFEMEV